MASINQDDADPKTTLVSMAFDLSSLEDAPKRLTFDFYMNRGDYLITSGLPLVIFTSEDLKGKIQDRIELLAPDNSEIKVIVVDPFQIITRYHRIKEIQMKIPGIMEPERPTTPLYVAINWGKIAFLERMAIENPFKTSHMCWVDYGITHMIDFKRRSINDIITVMHPKDNDVSGDNDIDRIHFTPPGLVDWKHVDESPEEYWSTYTNGFAGGLFGGTIEAIRRLSSRFWPITNTILDMGFAPLEQALLAYIFSKHPHEFQPWCGQYVDIGINWGTPIRATEYVISQTYRVHDMGIKEKDISICNLYLSEEQSRQILKGCEKGNYSLSGKDKADLLRTMYISRWYRSPSASRKELTKPIGELIIRWYTNDEGCRTEIDKAKDNFTNNLKFVDLKLPSMSSNDE